MIALTRSLVKKEELFIAGISYFSFGFYIIFSKVLRCVIDLFINGAPSKFYFFGSYCFRGQRLMDISELPLNEKLILWYGLFVVIKISLLAGCLFLFNKALQKVGHVIPILVVFSLFPIEAISLLVYYADNFLHTSLFWYFFSAAPGYIFSKELGLSNALPVLLACIGVALPLYALKRLQIYSPRILLVSLASVFLGVISVVLLFKALQEVSSFLS